MPNIYVVSILLTLMVFTVSCQEVPNPVLQKEMKQKENITKEILQKDGEIKDGIIKKDTKRQPPISGATFEKKLNSTERRSVILGAERMDQYNSKLRNKRIAILANHTSYIEETHLVDTLIASRNTIEYIYAPEHGFRGRTDAGATVKDGVDVKTGIQIKSLYGKSKKPSNSDLSKVDIFLIDIQDVGARFYTYITTVSYIMEACAENNVPVLILDRPNPHAHYVDGPVMSDGLESFVGLHSIPIVYGMTIGEYGKMLVGENWLDTGNACDLTVIHCQNYDRNIRYSIPKAPSPNLPNDLAIQLYPSLCLFEGTTYSEGRGTNKQFQSYGHPDYGAKDFSFIPIPNDGASKPKLNGVTCYGRDLSYLNVDRIYSFARLDLSYLLDAYNQFEASKKDFFVDNNFFELLAGTKELRKMIIQGKTELEIRASWQNDLEAFRKIREKYLLY